MPLSALWFIILSSFLAYSQLSQVKCLPYFHTPVAQKDCVGVFMIHSVCICNKTADDTNTCDSTAAGGQRASFMAALCNRAGHIYFHAVVSSSFFFFPRLISAVGDWMSTILPHMVWP